MLNELLVLKTHHIENVYKYLIYTSDDYNNVKKAEHICDEFLKTHSGWKVNIYSNIYKEITTENNLSKLPKPSKLLLDIELYRSDLVLVLNNEEKELYPEFELLEVFDNEYW